MWSCCYDFDSDLPDYFESDHLDEDYADFLRGLFSLFPTHVPYAIIWRSWNGRKRWPYVETEIAFSLKKSVNIAFNILCYQRDIEFIPIRNDQICPAMFHCLEDQSMIGILFVPQGHYVLTDLKYHDVVFPERGRIENMNRLVDLDGYLFLGEVYECWPCTFLYANDTHLPVLESPLIKKYWTEQRDLRDVKVPPSPGCLGCLGQFLKWIAGRIFK